MSSLTNTLNSLRNFNSNELKYIFSNLNEQKFVAKTILNNLSKYNEDALLNVKSSFDVEIINRESPLFFNKKFDNTIIENSDAKEYLMLKNYINEEIDITISYFYFDRISEDQKFSVNLLKNSGTVSCIIGENEEINLSELILKFKGVGFGGFGGDIVNSSDEIFRIDRVFGVKSGNDYIKSLEQLYTPINKKLPLKIFSKYDFTDIYWESFDTLNLGLGIVQLDDKEFVNNIHFDYEYNDYVKLTTNGINNITDGKLYPSLVFDYIPLSNGVVNIVFTNFFGDIINTNSILIEKGKSVYNLEINLSDFELFPLSIKGIITGYKGDTRNFGYQNISTNTIEKDLTEDFTFLFKNILNININGLRINNTKLVRTKDSFINNKVKVYFEVLKSIKKYNTDFELHFYNNNIEKKYISNKDIYTNKNNLEEFYITFDASLFEEIDIPKLVNIIPTTNVDNWYVKFLLPNEFKTYFNFYDYFENNLNNITNNIDDINFTISTSLHKEVREDKDNFKDNFTEYVFTNKRLNGPMFGKISKSIFLTDIHKQLYGSFNHEPIEWFKVYLYINVNGQRVKTYSSSIYNYEDNYYLMFDKTNSLGNFIYENRHDEIVAELEVIYYDRVKYCYSRSNGYGSSCSYRIVPRIRTPKDFPQNFIIENVLNEKNIITLDLPDIDFELSNLCNDLNISLNRQYKTKGNIKVELFGDNLSNLEDNSFNIDFNINENTTTTTIPILDGDNYTIMGDNSDSSEGINYQVKLIKCSVTIEGITKVLYLNNYNKLHFVDCKSKPDSNDFILSFKTELPIFNNITLLTNNPRYQNYEIEINKFTNINYLNNFYIIIPKSLIGDSEYYNISNVIDGNNNFIGLSDSEIENIRNKAI